MINSSSNSNNSNYTGYSYPGIADKLTNKKNAENKEQLFDRDHVLYTTQNEMWTYLLRYDRKT